MRRKQKKKMPPNFYHCKYCLQVTKTETALNRRIAHSAPCFQSWQNELVRLNSSTMSVEGPLNCLSLAIDPSMLPDAWDNKADVVYEELRADNDMLGRINQPPASNRGSSPTDIIEDADDACSQQWYRKPYPGGDAAEILGEGMTKFQQWEEDENLQGHNEWVLFQNQKEWDLVQWLIKNVGQKLIDEYLKLPLTSIGSYI